MSCTCESHNMYMCVLKAQGNEELIRSLSMNPMVECRQCGAKADSVRNLCAAHLCGEAPNVEGGHGSVNLEDIGKPHAG